jgi:aminoglycoside 6'-N-acetyltransferase I
MKIIDLTPENENAIVQVAEFLVEAFKEHWPDAWPNIEAARKEVEESFAEDRISRIALGEDGSVLGWIGGIEQYGGHVWELHPLVINPKAQGRGAGRALVQDLEEQARLRGGLTLWLGTDDEDGMTSLSGVDLYGNLWGQIKNIKNLRGHPFEFYQKLGFTIVGVMPDANGPGKPDIYMAKRIST